MQPKAFRILVMSIIGLLLAGTAGIVLLLNPSRRAPLAFVADGELLGRTTMIFEQVPPRPSGVSALLKTPTATWYSGVRASSGIHFLCIPAGRDSAIRRISNYRLHRPLLAVIKELQGLAGRRKGLVSPNSLYLAVHGHRKSLVTYVDSPSGPAAQVDLWEDPDPDCCLVTVFDDDDVTFSDRVEALLHRGFGKRTGPPSYTAILDSAPIEPPGTFSVMPRAPH